MVKNITTMDSQRGVYSSGKNHELEYFFSITIRGSDCQKIRTYLRTLTRKSLEFKEILIKLPNIKKYLRKLPEIKKILRKLSEIKKNYKSVQSHRGVYTLGEKITEVYNPTVVYTF